MKCVCKLCFAMLYVVVQICNITASIEYRNNTLESSDKEPRHLITVGSVQTLQLYTPSGACAQCTGLLHAWSLPNICKEDLML